MLVLHFLLVMAAITIYIRAASTMALAALTTRAAVVHWEGMIRNRHRMPVVCIMALRTLPLPVTSRPVMTGCTIGLTLVAERGWSPGVGVVTGRTLPVEMVGGAILSMAGLAIRQSLVAERSRPPGVRIVAARALPAEVICGTVLAVTGCTICQPLVINASRSPGTRIVAARALPVEVVGRLIFLMTGNTIGITPVAETGWSPGPGSMAIRALPGEVIRRTVTCVTGETVFRPSSGMIEMDLLPGICGMARCTVAGVVSLGFDGFMTGDALIRSAGKFTLYVAVFAFEPGVLACQWEKGMFSACATGQELHSPRVYTFWLFLATFEHLLACGDE